MLLQVGKLRQEAVSPFGRSAEAKAATGPCDSPLWDPNLGLGICKPAEPTRLAIHGHKQAAFPATSSISVAAVLLAYHGKVTLGKYAMYF